jgi:hypothetical protein
MDTGAYADLDFDSVQRGNAEMERRAQEVMIAAGKCWRARFCRFDVGAGGLSTRCRNWHTQRRRRDFRSTRRAHRGARGPARICATSRRRYVSRSARRLLDLRSRAVSVRRHRRGNAARTVIVDDPHFATGRWRISMCCSAIHRR